MNVQQCNLCDRKIKRPIIVSFPNADVYYFCSQKCLFEYFQRRKKRLDTKHQAKYATTSKGKATRAKASANYRARKLGGPTLPAEKGIVESDQVIINTLFDKLGIKLEEKIICQRKQ